MSVSSYNVKLINEEEGTDVSITCPADTYILDEADDQGVSLPYSCRAGACSTCAGILKEGSVNQEDQTYLDGDQIEQKWVLTCVAYPESDCTILTHKEQDLYEA